jgi:type II secretory pathway pseudopilin PulG
LIDLVVTVGVFATASAVAIPLMNSALDNLRLKMAARDVERELQTARLKAVSANRPIRIRFNCPATGQYRMVEMIGTPGSPDALDNDSGRCNDRLFPYPAADNDPLTRPNLDGPLRRLPPGVSFGNVQTIEFWPNGTAHASSGSATPWPIVPVSGVSLTLTKGASAGAVTVNGLGKIQVQ